MASGKKDILLGMIRNGLPMTLGQQIRLTILLSLPAIAAQISSVLMQYIDAGMECGIGIEKFNDLKVGDNIEAFVITEIKQTLD